MAWLCRFSIRRPALVLALALLVTALIAPGARRLRLRTDGHALVPERAPEVIADREIRDQFRFEDPVVVFIRPAGDHGIYNPPTLKLVQDLTSRLQELPGINPRNVTSLATERGDHVYPGTLRFRPFLDPMPESAEELDRLRNDLRQIELYTGTLVSSDGTATAIFVGVPDGIDRTALYRRIKELVDQCGDVPEQIDVIGAPVAEALLGTHILEDLGVPEVALGRRFARGDSPVSWRWPTSFYELRLLIAHHVGLLPVALLVMALVFFISFRGLAAVALPMMEVGACLAMVFGLMGWLDVPVYLTIAVLPVILTAVGVTDEIHLFHRYREQLIAQPDRSGVDVLRDTVDEMVRPVTKTAITTAIGFASFALSPIAPVRAFGIFTSLGVLLCMLWSFTAIPASLALLDPRRVARRRSGRSVQTVAARRVFLGIGWIVLRCRYVVLLGALGVTAVGIHYTRQVAVQDSWIDGFSPESGFHQATTRFNDQFLGTHTLLVELNAGRVAPITGEIPGTALDHKSISLPGNLVDDPATLAGRRVYLRPASAPEPTDPAMNPRLKFRWDSRIDHAERQGDYIIAYPALKDGSPKLALGTFDKPPTDPVRFLLRPEPFMLPSTIRRVEAFEQFIARRQDRAVGGVLGPASYLKTTNFLAQGRKAGSRSLPENYERAEYLWAQYGSVRGFDRLRQVLSEDVDRALISVYMKNANFIDVGYLMNEVRDFARANLEPHGISIEFAGDVAVSQALIDAIVATQVRSLTGSLLGVLLVTAVMGGSIVFGIVCTIPCALAVLINFAFMGLVGMPLGVASSMFTGMTLGVGVDHAIHLFERYRLSRSGGLTSEPALLDAVAATGPAIFVDALAVALGFGVLVLSQVPANARLGSLVALSIINGFLGTVLLVPALLRIRQR